MNTKQISLIIGGVVLIALAFMFTPAQTLVGGGNNNQFGPGEVHVTGSSLEATATKVMSYHSGRKYAVVTNTSDTLMYLAYSSLTSTSSVATATPATSFTIPVAASGGSYIINTDNLYYGNIFATGTAAKTYRTMEIY